MTQKALPNYLSHGSLFSLLYEILLSCHNCPFGLNLLSAHSLCNFILLDQQLYCVCMIHLTAMNPMTLPLQLYLHFLFVLLSEMHMSSRNCVVGLNLKSCCSFYIF